MGETFIQAIVDLQFKTSAKLQLLRASLVAANLVAPKVVDGIARLVTPTDVASLKSKDKLILCTAAESFLGEAWDTINDQIAVAAMPEQKAHCIFGAASSRIALFLVKKQKQSYESVEYDSIKAIKTKFFDDLAEGGADCDATKPQASGSKHEEAQISLRDVSSPMRIAQQEDGVEFGKLYKEKATGIVFQVTGMCDALVTLTEKDSESEPAVRLTAWDAMKREFAIFKGRIQTTYDCDDVEKFAFRNNVGMKKDVERAQIFIELMQAGQAWAHLEASYLEYCHGPTEVRVKAPGLQKGNLKLIPVTDLYKIHARSLTCRTVLTGETQQDAYYLEAPNRVRDNDVSKWKRESIFAAYWWVSKTNSEKDATMKISTMKIGTFKFPILENTRALKVGDKLQVYQPPSAMQLAKKARR